MGHALQVRLAALRTLGAGGETFPVFFDDPFVHLAASAKPSLLGLLAGAAHTQQIIYLTEDPDVATWARLEAVGGDLAIVEPGSGRKPNGDDDRKRAPKRSRHVAA